MKASDKAVSAICYFEGIRYKPYRDSVGLWTVGVGHLMYPEQTKLSKAEIMAFPLKPEDDKIYTQIGIENLLRLDLVRMESGIGRYVTYPLTQGMFDALVSFTFNLGVGILQRSTLRQKLNRGDKEGAAKEFLRYCMAGGKVLGGLKKRRIAEQIMFIS